MHAQSLVTGTRTRLLGAWVEPFRVIIDAQVEQVRSRLHYVAQLGQGRAIFPLDERVRINEAIPASLFKFHSFLFRKELLQR